MAKGKFSKQLLLNNEIAPVNIGAIFFICHLPLVLHPSGELAQLVERLHGMQEVSGSNPLFSTYEIWQVFDFISFIFFNCWAGVCSKHPGADKGDR